MRRDAYKLGFMLNGQLNEIIYTNHRLAIKMQRLFGRVLGNDKVRLWHCDCINFEYNEDILQMMVYVDKNK